MVGEKALDYAKNSFSWTMLKPSMNVYVLRWGGKFSIFLLFPMVSLVLNELGSLSL
jgi:hypothetical protein